MSANDASDAVSLANVPSEIRDQLATWLEKENANESKQEVLLNLPAGLMKSREGETDPKNNQLLNRNDVKKESQKNQEHEIEIRRLDELGIKEHNK